MSERDWLQKSLQDLPEYEAPEHFSAKVMARIAKEEKQRKMRAFFSVFASCACVLVLGVLIFRGTLVRNLAPKAEADGIDPTAEYSDRSDSPNAVLEKNAKSLPEETAWKYIEDNELPRDTTWKETESEILFFNAKGEQIASIIK